MKFGYIMDENGFVISPLNLNIKDYCHLLLCGKSGSGKSTSALYLIGCLLQDSPEIEIHLVDFKNSDDFKFLTGYKKYYTGDDSYAGILEFYRSFCEIRESGVIKRRILIIDEYAAFLNYLSIKDKQEKTKKYAEITGAIAEILMLGRGIGQGLWILLQRPSAELFSNGSRDNFMVVISLGHISKEQRNMLFSGEDIPPKILRRGEGYILADGYSLKLIAYPMIKNIVYWKKKIMEILMEHHQQ